MSITRLMQARRHQDAKAHPSAAGGPVENDEYASFIRRVLCAYARWVAAGDIDALADMTGLAAEPDDVISQAVAGLHETGYRPHHRHRRLRARPGRESRSLR